MALQAASAQLWPHLGRGCRTTGATALVTTCGELKSTTGKTVRASTPYPPFLEPGIEDWLFVWRLESARAHGGLTELGNVDLTDTQIRALKGGRFQLLDVRKNYALFRQHSADPPQL
jgi:hypothetical protein